MTNQQAQFIIDDFLKRFKGDYTKVSAKDLPVIEGMLLESGKEFNDVVELLLEQNGSVDTGGLQDLGIPNVYAEGDNVILEVGYPLNSKQIKYYDFINKGVVGHGKGKNPKPNKASGEYKFRSTRISPLMADALLKWAERASLSITTDKVDLSETQRKRRKVGTAFKEANDQKKLGYLIAGAVKRDGIKATYYFDQAVEKVFNQQFVENLEKALKADLEIKISSINGSNNS